MRNALSFEFAVQLGLLLVACWLRIYVHYLGARARPWGRSPQVVTSCTHLTGQWLFLKGRYVAVFDFRPLAYSVVLKFVASAITAEVHARRAVCVCVWGGGGMCLCVSVYVCVCLCACVCVCVRVGFMFMCDNCVGLRDDGVPCGLSHRPAPSRPRSWSWRK